MRHGNVVIGIAVSLALHGALLALVARLPASTAARSAEGAVLVPLRLLSPDPKSGDDDAPPVAATRPEAAVVSVPSARGKPPASPIVRPAMRPAAHRKAVPRDPIAPPVETTAVAKVARNAGIPAVAAAEQAPAMGDPAGPGPANGDETAPPASGEEGPAGRVGPGGGPTQGAAASGAADNLSDLRQAYALDVRRSLEAVGRYRTVARRLGLAGRVTLRVRIDDAGQVSESRIDAPSRYRELDAAALESTRRLHALGPPPGGAIDVIVPVVFTMRTR